jgi:CheY-like chemotaxis protein
MATPASLPMVFIVEDEPTTRDMLRAALGHRYRLRAFVNGSEALAALLLNPPDLLLSDLQLPGVAGEALAAAASTLPGPPAVVLMSGDDRRLSRAKRWAQSVLDKPFSLADVLQVVETALVERVPGL